MHIFCVESKLDIQFLDSNYNYKIWERTDDELFRYFMIADYKTVIENTR